MEGPNLQIVGPVRDYGAMQAGRARNYLRRLKHWLRLDQLSPGVRRTVVAVVGGTILLIGVALMVLPGPAFIVIPIGLTILATEFAWAGKCLQKAQGYLRCARDRFRKGQRKES